MEAEPRPSEGRLGLQQARDLTHCFGHHRLQTLDYALHYCLRCRKLKSCVRASWGADRQRRWRAEDWWPVAEAAQRPSSTPTRSKRKPVNIS